MDQNLFPKNEEWATGDEALDLKLTLALKKAANELSFNSISQFYFYASSVKTRTHNPSFIITVELLTKALLFYLYPDMPNDELLKKIKGEYENKKKRPLVWPQYQEVIKDLKLKKSCRYNSQIDFSIVVSLQAERNPFLLSPLCKGPFELHTKILFKDFKHFLNGDSFLPVYDDNLFIALRDQDTVWEISNFAELWYHKGLIYSLPLFE